MIYWRTLNKIWSCNRFWIYCKQMSSVYECLVECEIDVCGDGVLGSIFYDKRERTSILTGESVSIMKWHNNPDNSSCVMFAVYAMRLSMFRWKIHTQRLQCCWWRCCGCCDCYGPSIICTHNSNNNNRMLSVLAMLENFCHFASPLNDY